MNWATCLEKQGRVASAWQRWNEAVDLLAPSDSRKDFAKRHVAALEKRLPRLTLRLDASAPEGTRLYRDDVLVGKGARATALPVDPGRHVLRAVAPDHEGTTLTVVMREGENRVVSLGPGARAILPGPDDEDQGVTRTLGLVAAGVGAAGLGTGIVTSVMLKDARDTVNENCVERMCNAEGLDAAARGKTLLAVNAAGWGAGAIGAALGAILLIKSGRAPEEEGASHDLSVKPRHGGAQVAYRVTF
jgi:hypothetical protein